MNLVKVFTENKLKLIEEAGVIIEDKEYSQEELRNCEMQIEEYIMSKSSKNGDVSKYGMEYSDILNDLINLQQNRRER